MSALTLDTVVVASRDQVAADLASEFIILGLRDGVYYGVDGVAARLWTLVQQETRVGDLVRIISAEYAVPDERCRGDVLSFLADCEARGLVSRVGDGS